MSSSSKPERKILWTGALLDATVTIFLEPDIKDMILFDVSSFDITINGGFPVSTAPSVYLPIDILLDAITSPYMDAVLRDYKGYKDHGHYLQ